MLSTAVLQKGGGAKQVQRMFAVYLEFPKLAAELSCGSWSWLCAALPEANGPEIHWVEGMLLRSCMGLQAAFYKAVFPDTDS